MTHVIISNGTCTRPKGSGVEHGYLIGEMVDVIKSYADDKGNVIRVECVNIQGLRQFVMPDHIQER